MSWSEPPVLILGAGVLASGTAYRLVHAGYPVVMTELARPSMLRTTVSYGACVPHGSVIIDGVTARRAALTEVPDVLAEGVIPVVIDADSRAIRILHAAVVIDARGVAAEHKDGISISLLVIGIGPGFTAGINCHTVVAAPITSQPVTIYAPNDGEVVQSRVIGQRVKAGTVVARVDGTPVTAPCDGILQGLIDDNVVVTEGIPIGEIDPKIKREECFTLSETALAVGDRVLDVVVTAW